MTPPLTPQEQEDNEVVILSLSQVEDMYAYDLTAICTETITQDEAEERYGDQYRDWMLEVKDEKLN